MIHSMTAYGRAEDSGDWGNAACEIRSVNHRYLEATVSLPEELRMLEQTIHETISKRLKRGKVDCRFRFKQQDFNAHNLSVDTKLLDQLIETADMIQARSNVAATINILDLLRLSGNLDQDALDLKAIGPALLKLVEQTLDLVVDARHREGEKIKIILVERCTLMKENVAKVRLFSPSIIEHQREKLRQKAEALTVTLTSDRLEQELLILLQKMDVAEELDRLDAHIDEVCHILNQTKNDPIGRRLDFLMQEMNREANTLGSKSIHLDSTQLSVELKVLIEQMREQIQNIE